MGNHVNGDQIWVGSLLSPCASKDQTQIAKHDSRHLPPLSLSQPLKEFGVTVPILELILELRITNRYIEEFWCE